MILSASVAIDLDGVIGVDNRLPWRMPADLARFKQLTMGKPMVMGRRTWESIGRPLPGRRSIVVSREPELRAEGAEVARSLDEAIARAQAAPGGAKVEEAVVIGGASLFREAMARLDRLYLGVVCARFRGDARLPPLEGEWTALEGGEQAADEKNPHRYAWVVLARPRGDEPRFSLPRLLEELSARA